MTDAPPSPRAHNGTSDEKKKRNRFSAAFDSLKPKRNAPSFARIFSAQVRVIEPPSPSSSMASSVSNSAPGHSPSPSTPVSGASTNSYSPYASSPRIITSTSVFGCPIPTDPDKLVDSVPLVVHRCVSYMLKKGYNMEGIFRVPASVAEIRSFKAMYDRGEDPNLEATVRTPHIVAGLLKLYLRELSEPLLTFEFYEMFVVSTGIPLVEERLKKIKMLIEYLPRVNYDTLYFLISFFRILLSFRDKTKMDAGNLATVFAPNLLRANLNIQEEAKDAPLASSLIVHFIEDFDKLFTQKGPLPTAPLIVSSPAPFLSVVGRRRSSKNGVAVEMTVLTPSANEPKKIPIILTELTEGGEEVPSVASSKSGSSTSINSISSQPSTPTPQSQQTQSLLTPSSPSPATATLSPRNTLRQAKLSKASSASNLASSSMASPKSPSPSIAGQADPYSASSLSDSSLLTPPTASRPKKEADAVPKRRKRSGSISVAKDESIKSTPVTRSVSAKDLTDKKTYAITPIAEEFLADVQAFRLDALAEKIREGVVDIDCTDDRGWTGLMFAATTNDQETVALLINAGCNVNLQNQTGETALYRAASCGSLESARLLVEAGADLHRPDDEGRSPIIISAYAGERQTCAYLLKKGALVDDQDRLTQKTPLVLAAYAGHLDTCELLIQHGADVNIVDAFGWSALMMAAYSGHERVVKLLLQHKASITASTKKGKTAAMIALDGGYSDLYTLLSTTPAPKTSRKRTGTKSKGTSMSTSVSDENIKRT